VRVKVFLIGIILSLVPWGNAIPQEKNLSGEVSMTPAQVDVQGSRAKFNEYRDLRTGVRGHIDLHYNQGRNYFDLNADGMGYRDQKYEFEGGSRGGFRFNLEFDEIPHNFSSDKALRR
jgi:Putative outer membrane beta-barrel porin, MtrB/PioB